MRFRFLAIFRRSCLTVSLLMASGEGGWSQSPSGTLQAPAPQNHKEPLKPPVSAPRQPVHQAASPPVASPPVVSPHGPLHPHKPPNALSRAPSAATPGGPPQAPKSPAPPETPSQPSIDAPAESKAAATQKLPD